jgi:hypothetical protein
MALGCPGSTLWEDHADFKTSPSIHNVGFPMSRLLQKTRRTPHSMLNLSFHSHVLLPFVKPLVGGRMI